MPTADGVNALLLLASILLTGLAFGALARRLRLPGVTGQIVAGILIGPHALDLFDPSRVEGLQPVTHFALGLMAVGVGAHLNLRRLRNAGKRLGLLLVAESTVTPLVVGAVLLTLTRTTFTEAALFSTLAISTAPATVLALVNEARATGVFVRTLLAAVALNNIACIFLFELARGLARAELRPESVGSLTGAFGLSLAQVGLAAVLGAGIGFAVHVLTRGVEHEGKLGSAAAIAIILTTGLAAQVDVSPLLACTVLGFVQTNLTPRREKIADRVLGNLEPAILAIFFTLAGMHLSFEHAAFAGVVAVLFAAARVAGKVLAAGLAMRLAGATEPVRRFLGLALTPQAGVAIGLVILIQDDPIFEGLRDLFVAVVLTAVTLAELVGPILTRWSLARSGEEGHDRPRLIDFLGEHAIVTNLEADTKEAAIAKLTDLMVRAHHLRDVDRDELLQSILERESQASTCVGHGLAIPHGELAKGQQMVGVLGLSRHGLPFETPDGLPVHCMVLLATPAQDRDRHLQVLSALARSLGADLEFQQRLREAASPAHAYEILHGAEAEGFNYFLGDAV